LIYHRSSIARFVLVSTAASLIVSGCKSRVSKEGLVANPFEDKDAMYLVLVNEEGQHSLWPEFVDVPGGWAVAFGPSKRDLCIEYMENHWTDMRPKSLIARMG
jgi:MbtH protein